MEESLQKFNADQKISYWAELVSECRSSGMTVKDWCAERGFKTKNYYYWQKKVYDAAMSAKEKVFIQPQIVEAKGTRAIACLTCGSVRIELYPGIDASSAVELIRALKQC